MKKLYAILLAAVLVLALSACANNTGGSTENNTDTAKGEVTASAGINADSESPSQLPETPIASSEAPSSSVPATTTSDVKISRDEAIEKALAAAGVKRADVRDLEADLDRDPDGLFWEVDFEVGAKEYDYDVNAQTGEVFDNKAKPATSDKKLTRDEAIAKALAAAGVKKEAARELEAELDTEHGGVFWEVEFESGNTEYSYDINASTGEIVRAERERD